MKLLLVEDDPGITGALNHVLAANYEIECVPRGSEGLEKARSQDYDIIILDLNLPDIPGLMVCKRLREENITTPILIISGEAKVMSKIALLDAGADDYLTKPFSLGELKARLRVLTRRGNNKGRSRQKLIADDLILDTATRQVERAGRTITLRRKEFALLECLMQNPGVVVTRDALTKHAWSSDENPWSNTVDVHIKYLRDKVDRPFSRPLIKTIHGLGYKLETSGSR